MEVEFQTFMEGCGNEKARGAILSTALWKTLGSLTQGARGFMVGIKPICGLPTAP